MSVSPNDLIDIKQRLERLEQEQKLRKTTVSWQIETYITEYNWFNLKYWFNFSISFMKGNKNSFENGLDSPSSNLIIQLKQKVENLENNFHQRISHLESQFEVLKSNVSDYIIKNQSWKIFICLILIIS